LVTQISSKNKDLKFILSLRISKK